MEEYMNLTQLSNKALKKIKNTEYAKRASSGNPPNGCNDERRCASGTSGEDDVFSAMHAWLEQPLVKNLVTQHLFLPNTFRTLGAAL